MVKSGIRAALQESEPIGYLPARAKYIHNTGCQVGGKESLKQLKNEAPEALRNMSAKIMKYYEQRKKRRSKKKAHEDGRISSKKSSKKSKGAKSKRKKTPTRRNQGKRSTQKGAGAMTQSFLNVLNKPALSAVIVLLALNQLAGNWSKYKLKGGASKRSQKNEVEKFKKMLSGMKKNSLVRMAETLLALAPMKPSDKRYGQLTSIVNVSDLKQAGGFHLNINKLGVATLLFLLQQVIDKKWVKSQRGGSRKGKRKSKKSGAGCGCNKLPSDKALFGDLDRVISQMHGGAAERVPIVRTAPRSHVYNQGETSCMQPDWCAQCV